MSKLLKVLYDVAEIRCRYHGIHEAVFGFSPRKLLRTLNRPVEGDQQAEAQELDRLLSRLYSAGTDLESLSEEDLSVRRGHEIRRALLDYVEALTESSNRLKALCELPQRAEDRANAEFGNRQAALKVVYDDAMQYHRRLGARLNQLISTL